MNGIGTVSPSEVSRNGTAASSRASTLTPPSSLHLDEGGILNGMNDFEEIGLGDDDDDRRGRSTHNRTLHRGNSAPLNSLRDLTHAKKRPPYPSLQTNVSNPVHDHLTAPSSRSRKALASKSTPALVRPRSRTRRRSPTPQVSSHREVNGVVTPVVPNGPAVSPRAPKRMSWQGRKTSEQIEQEYDSDDDVPPDTIFYNVPLSPRSSRAYSISPDRDSKSPNSSGNPTPATPRPKTLPPSSGAVPIRGSGSRSPSETRAKSWSDAMQELGDDAKELSEKLEKHAEEQLQALSRERQQAQRRSEPPPLKKGLSETKLTELPPLQISNGMIDPLPISKEKEAVLSRTRPSWLPPKSKEEEKRHLKEYQKMMRRSQDAERKRAEKERQEQQAREKMKAEFHNVWEKNIIPNWRTASREKETRELWWKGIAPRCRGTVWQLAFGNHLAASPETFQLALKRAKEIELGVKKSPSMYSNKERELFPTIRRDVDRTFPDMKIFQVGPDGGDAAKTPTQLTTSIQRKGPLHQQLLDVLMAYSMYRSDVGYVYGTHVIAGLLLLNLSPDQAFITLANMLNRPLPLAFFTQDEGAMSRATNLFLKAFQYKLPSLHRHIHVTLGIPPMAYLEPMFLSLFALHCPIDIASRLWDVYSFEGDSFLVRTAVAVMATLESKLYGDYEEVMKMLGWDAPTWSLGKEDEFLEAVRQAGKEDIDRPAADHR